MVHVGAYCIRPTNVHNHGQMIDLPGTFRGVCNTPLPIRDKYLINTNLLNPIPVKDWMVRVGAYCIRPTNTHDHGQMINPPDTFRVVCNTPLPIRDKYMINTYLLNLISGKDWMVWIIMPIKPGTFWGVCTTPLPVQIKNLIPIYRMNLKPDTCRGVCNTPLHIRVKNLIPIYWMNLKPGTCRVVCNTPLPIRIKNLIPIYRMNLKLDRFLGVCLCDHSRHGEKPLKFVWIQAKLGEDWMDVTNAIRTPTSYS